MINFLQTEKTETGSALPPGCHSCPAGFSLGVSLQLTPVSSHPAHKATATSEVTTSAPRAHSSACPLVPVFLSEMLTNIIPRERSEISWQREQLWEVFPVSDLLNCSLVFVSKSIRQESQHEVHVNTHHSLLSTQI